MRDLRPRPPWLRPVVALFVVGAHAGPIFLGATATVEPGSGVVEILAVSEPDPSPEPTPDRLPTDVDRLDSAAVSPPPADEPVAPESEPREPESTPPIPTPVPQATVVPPPKPERHVDREPDAPKRHKKKPERQRTTKAPIRDTAAEEASNASARAANEEARRAAAASYASLVLGELRRHRHFPAAARAEGIQGVALVAFTIGPSGTVVSHAIVRSSGHAVLDASVHDMMNAMRLPPPPGGSYHQTVPIRFELN